VANRTEPVQAQANEVIEELLTSLPRIHESISVRVWRTTFPPGKSWERRYRGKASIMVESGTMTVPQTPEKPMEIIITGPTLGPAELGLPSSWTSDPYAPPNFTRYQGVIAEDGDFGVIANNGTEDLVVIVVETIPDLTA
jgi:hypothetical protein